MADTKQKVSIHARKYYKVILEEIDRNRETPETFAMKLSIRTRMTMPRANLVARHLPRIVRKDISANAANRLKAVLEDIGGRARIESYLVTPDEGRDKPEDSAPVEGPNGTATCPECGTEVEKDAKFCAFCLRRFRDEKSRPQTLEGRLPDDNPFEEPDFIIESSGNWVAWLKENPLLVASGAIVLLLLFLIIK